MHPLIYRIFLQVVFVLGLSWASGYEIKFPDSNWETTLFLTPLGIFQNLSAANTLSTFYFDPARGQADLNSLMLLFYLAISVNGWLIFRSVRSS